MLELLDKIMDKKLAPYYKTHKWYAVSFNPDDSLQFFGKKDRFKRFRNKYYEMFLGLIQKGIHYRFFIEISEPRGTVNTAGRLHLHGKVYFHSNRAIKWFLVHGLTEWTNHCRLDIDTIDDSDTWDKYISKQQTLFAASPSEESKSPPLTNYEESSEELSEETPELKELPISKSRSQKSEEKKLPTERTVRCRRV